jgi:hypothetical protein
MNKNSHFYLISRDQEIKRSRKQENKKTRNKEKKKE